MGGSLQRWEINHSAVLTVEQQEYVLTSIVTGRTIKQICDTLKIPIHHIYDYASKDPDFDKKMERSRVYQAHLLIDELLTVTDGCNTFAEVNRAKVWSDNAKWVASKMVPTKYGENLNINMNHTLDLSSVLLAAENRVMPLLQAKASVVPTSSEDIIDVGIESERPETIEDLF